MQTSVLLSIKPEYANKIFEGTKRFEFRRKLFTNRNVNRIVVYVTAPVSQVIGEFEIAGILELDLDELWEKTKEFSGIKKEFFDAYFYGQEKGYAIKIGPTTRYENPLELSAKFKVKHPPQSFVYLDAAGD